MKRPNWPAIWLRILKLFKRQAAQPSETAPPETTETVQVSEPQQPERPAPRKRREPKLKRDHAEVAERIVELLEGLSALGNRAQRGTSIQAVDGAWPLVADDEKTIGHPCFGGETCMFRPPGDVKLNELHGSLDVAMLTRSGLRHESPSRYAVHSLRVVDARRGRGRIKFIPPCLINGVIGMVDIRAGRVMLTQYFVGVLPGERLVPMDPESERILQIIREDEGRTIIEEIGMPVSIQYTRELFWNVYLALEDPPGISLPTDPIGAAEIFRLRDIPAGRQRRAALRHWVRSHYRQERGDDSEALTYVRRHLRGARQFDWAGLKCRIEPSRSQVADLIRETGRVLCEKCGSPIGLGAPLCSLCLDVRNSRAAAEQEMLQ